MQKKKILILVETSRVYGRRIIEGITHYALENGQWVLLVEDRGLTELEQIHLERFHCDGIISRTLSEEMARAISKFSVPVVELLGDGVMSFPDLLADPERFARTAIDHLREKGLRHFAFFSTGRCWWSHEFYTLYRSLLEKQGFQCHLAPSETIENSVSLPVLIDQTLEKKILKWVRLLPKPIGVFCPADSHGIYLLNLCREEGIPVPYEISVLGVENNVALCNSCMPALSSITANGRMLGYLAAKLLNKRMNAQPLPRLPIKIPPLYVATRLSTSFIAVENDDLRNALQYITDHISSRLSVEDIAKHVGISRRSLARRFHNYLGHAPEKEIFRIRMNRAQELLVETGLPISIIGKSVGYQSAEYFIRVFHQTFGITPKQFRENGKKKR